MEEIIGDDTFGALLNADAEVQVGGQIYKYTDVGLFIVDSNDYGDLESYLNYNKISDNLLIPTNEDVRMKIIDHFPSGQNTSFTFQSPDSKDLEPARITYFNSYTESTDQYAQNGTPANYSNIMEANDEDIPSIVQNLKVGEVHTPWVGNLFGKVWDAYDNYQGRRRVKVKFYSQNFGLAYGVGCKVKNQYKGWTGLWRKEDADKLGIGINAIKWQFAHSAGAAAANNPSIPRQSYWIGDNHYYSNDGINFQVKFNSTKPNFPFKDLDGVVEIITERASLSTKDVNDIFWTQVWKQANKFMEGQNKKLNRVAVVVDSYSAVRLNLYDFSQVEENQDGIERVFDWGVATPKLTYTFGGGVGNGASVNGYTFDFLRPDAIGVQMYGIAKKNGSWHGVILRHGDLEE